MDQGLLCNVCGATGFRGQRGLRQHQRTNRACQNLAIQIMNGTGAEVAAADQIALEQLVEEQRLQLERLQQQLDQQEADQLLLEEQQAEAEAEAEALAQLQLVEQEIEEEALVQLEEIEVQVVEQRRLEEQRLAQMLLEEQQRAGGQAIVYLWYLLGRALKGFFKGLDIFAYWVWRIVFNIVVLFLGIGNVYFVYLYLTGKISSINRTTFLLSPNLANEFMER